MRRMIRTGPVSKRPISRGEIKLRHGTRLPQELIRYIFDYWFGDDESQLIIDWKNRMKPLSDNLNNAIHEQIDRQYSITGTSQHIEHLQPGLFPEQNDLVLHNEQETLYRDNISSGFIFKYEIRNNLDRILAIKNVKRELVIYRKIFNDKTFDARNTYFKYRICNLYKKRGNIGRRGGARCNNKYDRHEIFGNPDEKIDLKQESGLYTLPITVKRKDNKRLPQVEVYSKNDFIQSTNKTIWHSRYGKQTCNKLSSAFIKLWKEGKVELPDNNRLRHLLLTNKSGKKYVKTICSDGLILNNQKTQTQTQTQKQKQKQTPKNNNDLYNKTGQELRDILSYWTNKPTGIKSSGSLKTKQAIIDKIVELSADQVVFV